MANLKSRKIAVLGSRSVGTKPLFKFHPNFSILETNIFLFLIGKSSLTVQFVENHFVESYYPTIENTFSKTIKIKNQEFATEIIDTAGQVFCPLSLFVFFLIDIW